MLVLRLNCISISYRFRYITVCVETTNSCNDYECISTHSADTRAPLQPQFTLCARHSVVRSAHRTVHREYAYIK